MVINTPNLYKISPTIFNWGDKTVRQQFQKCLKYNDIVRWLITIHTMNPAIMVKLHLDSNKVFYI